MIMLHTTSVAFVVCCAAGLSNSITTVEHARHSRLIDWLSMVLRLHQHNKGYTADGLYRSDDPTNSVKALKEGG